MDVKVLTAPAIRLHANDNVVVARTNLPRGTALPELGLTTLDNVPAANKIAARDIKQGEPILKYNTVIGFAASSVLPARAGEVLRAVILKRREGVSVSASLATIIVERIFDGVVMLSFVFINLGELAKLTGSSGFVGSIQSVALWGSLAFIGALAIFLVAAMFPARTSAIGQWFIDRLVPARFREQTSGIMHKFLDGLASLRSPWSILMVFFTSVLIWLLETAKYWFVMHAFDFSVSFFALMLMNGIVNLATTLPSAPGYIGTFDAPGIAVLMAYGESVSLLPPWSSRHLLDAVRESIFGHFLHERYRVEGFWS